MAWRGQAALARPTPIGASGAALGGPHGAVDFASGTKGQRPLVFPACAGLRGRAVAPRDDVALCAAIGGVPHGTPPSREDRYPRWAKTPVRWLGRRLPPIEPCPAGPRPVPVFLDPAHQRIRLQAPRCARRQSVDDLAFRDRRCLAVAAPTHHLAPQSRQIGELTIDLVDMKCHDAVHFLTRPPRIIGQTQKVPNLIEGKAKIA